MYTQKLQVKNILLKKESQNKIFSCVKKKRNLQARSLIWQHNKGSILCKIYNFEYKYSKIAGGKNLFKRES